MEIISKLFPVLFVTVCGAFIIIFIKKVRYAIDDKNFKTLVAVLLTMYTGYSIYSIFTNASPLLNIIAVLELIILMMVIGLITNDKEDK